MVVKWNNANDLAVRFVSDVEFCRRQSDFCVFYGTDFRSLYFVLHFSFFIEFSLLCVSCKFLLHFFLFSLKKDIFWLWEMGHFSYPSGRIINQRTGQYSKFLEISMEILWCFDTVIDLFLHLLKYHISYFF